ncbi:hypothetical protein B484DRAFT_436819 [Ochromonadaceae sp. CCMP2298]|nr:hypothetical protein B484DRAFT_436819 [Ochromonadaceae sp. CCMP2298]
MTLLRWQHLVLFLTLALFLPGSSLLRRPPQKSATARRLGRLYANKPLPSLASLVEVFEGPSQLQIALCSEFMEIATSEIYRSGDFFAAVSGDISFEVLRGLKNYTSLWWPSIHIFHLDWKLKATLVGPPATSEVGDALMRELGLNQSVALLSTYNEWTASDMDRYDYIGHQKRPPNLGGLPAFDYVLLGADSHTGFNPSHPLPLPLINNAKRRRIVMMGRKNARALRLGVFQGKSADRWPLCGVCNDGDTKWLVDVPCATLL